MEKKTNTTKITWINNLRAIACLSIIMIHVVAGWLYSGSAQPLETGSTRWFIDNVLFEVIFRSGVPIFLMISGAILLNPNKKVDGAKLDKYIRRMLLILATFGFAYCFLEQLFANRFSNIHMSIINSVINLFSGKSWGHMWYVYMLIGIYILTPILRAFTKDADNKTYANVLYGLFFISIIIPTINLIFKTNLISFYLESLIHVFYYLAGYFFAYKYNGSINNTMKILVVSVLANIIVTSVFNIGYSATYANVFLAISSIALFYLFSKCACFNKENKVLDVISYYSCGIYLVHTFWLNLFNKGFGLFPDVMPILIGEIVFFVVTLILSLISSYIIYRTPFIKKLFIG